MSEQVFNVSKLGVVEGYPERVVVPDEFTDWEKELTGYEPPYYISEAVKKRGGKQTDSEDITQVGNFAASAEGPLKFDQFGRPLNPLGRTGLAGMGVLWYYGPSVAGDLIHGRGSTVDDLEIVTGERRDNGKRALTGGFQDRFRCGNGTWGFEWMLDTAFREHMEEVGIDLREAIKFLKAKQVFSGIVRNSLRQTDNAWIETNVYAINTTHTIFSDMQPIASDDLVEGSAQWSKVKELDLDAMHDDHGAYIQKYVEMFNET